MRLGGFELSEPLPDMKGAHALAVLRPWVDVGSVGTLAISYLEAQLGAEELGRLARPGNFFDFTRYRPTIYFKEGRRQVTIPNTLINYAKREGGNEFLFLHLLEPHMLGEVYVDSVLRGAILLATAMRMSGGSSFHRWLKAYFEGRAKG